MIHISFDLWNTLISSNPEFSEQRNYMISKELNIPVDIVNVNYKSIKNFLDLQAEYNSTGNNTIKNWELLIGSLSKYKDISRVRSIANKLESTSNILFKKHQPYLSTELIKVIREIKGYDVSIGIISNTNFVSGHIIREALFDDKGLINIYTFSDQEHVSKPSLSIFRTHYDQVAGMRTVSKNYHNVVDNSLHIGDNEICDGGSVHLGLQFELVRNPQHTIEVLSIIKSNLDKTYNP